MQLLIDQGDVLVNGLREKASLKLRGSERIDITGEPHPAPLKATAEEIPVSYTHLDVYKRQVQPFAASPFVPDPKNWVPHLRRSLIAPKVG